MSISSRELTENLGKTNAQECESPLPVDVRRSKSPLLTFPNVGRGGGGGTLI